MRLVKAFVLTALATVMAVFWVVEVYSQSTVGQYMTTADHVFQTDSDCFAVARGTRFKFVTVGSAQVKITFTEIFEIAEDQVQRRESVTKSCSRNGGENRATQNDIITFLSPVQEGPIYEVDLPSSGTYREVGLRIAFGTLTVPFRYLLSEHEFVPGAKIGGYIGGQFAIYADMAIIFAVSAGYGQISLNGDSHESVALAIFSGIKLGSAFHGGVIVGVDFAEDSYKYDREPWISFSIGADLLETFDI